MHNYYVLENVLSEMDGKLAISNAEVEGTGAPH